MARQTARKPDRLLNAALVLLGLVLLVLLWSFAARLLSQPTGPQREENPTALAGPVIQIEVRNGSGATGVAAHTTRYLRDRGFDVVEVGNHSSTDVATTLVIDRAGNLEAARRVAAVLGLAEDRVRQELRPDLYLDASVILGRDYTALKPFEQK